MQPQNGEPGPERGTPLELCRRPSLPGPRHSAESTAFGFISSQSVAAQAATREWSAGATASAAPRPWSRACANEFLTTSPAAWLEATMGPS